MNSTERIMATLAGKPLDRRAVSPVLSLYGARLIGCPLDQYYMDPAAYARGQSAVRETFRPDVLFAPLAFASIGAAFGSELVFTDTDVPNIRRPAVQTVEDWDLLLPPDPDTDPRLLYFREAIRLMAAEHGDQVPIAMVIPIPADIPGLVMGLEAWLETVLFDPAEAQLVMEKVIPFYVQLVNGFFAAGAKFVAMPSAFASPTIVTRDIVSSFTRPILDRVLSQLHGPVILHNVGAPLLPHLDLLTGLPAMVGVIMDQRDDLARARQVVGSDIVLFGGLDCSTISQMTVSEVKDRCRVILEERRQDPRFVLSTSGPDVVWNTPPENIHAMLKTAESTGSVGV
ncbi:MAG TPA: uroporphyrinogen decarboxylase family protein [Gammaproteobacteria bacterium]|nr:uroporphyrinogen decarboxylase family protein [Gammaproteobacteria bacterium]